MLIDYSPLHDALAAAGLPLTGVSNGVPVYSRALTAPEQATAAGITGTPLATHAAQALRAKAKALLDATDDRIADALRALVLVLVDEINLLRQRDRDRSVDVAGAATLAALKTAWAARPPLADRTGAQARAAIKSHLDSGDADS